MLAGVELFDAAQPDPWWSSPALDLRRLLVQELPAGMADGWTFTAPVIDMPVYLAWLRADSPPEGSTWCSGRCMPWPTNLRPVTW